MPLGGILGAGASALGGIIGGIAGAGDRDAAKAKQDQANQIIQNLANAPDASRPLILQQYRQAGILTPDMEAAISAGPSAMQNVTTNGQGIQAQQAALKQMQDRATTGMTATDRAALAKAQSQSAVAENAKQQQILQQFKQMGQGGGTAQLAAQLQAAQGGANENSQNALDIMGRSQQQALQAAAQSGGMGSQLEGQQFGEQSAKAQAADQMQRFNTQNQIAAQNANVQARNQAQASNLANLQNVGNQNVNMSNQEAARQRAGEQQNFANQTSLAGMKAGSLAGQASNLQASGDKTAQGFSNMGTGIGGMLSNAFSPSKPDYSEFGADTPGVNYKYNGGLIKDYTNGGHVNGQEMVPGDHPENDTVDAKLSPGEIVVPKSIAQTSLGDKLLDLLKHHHEIKTHLDAIEKKANKPKKQKFDDGGQVQPSNIDLFTKSLRDRLNPPPPVIKHEETMDEKNDRIRQQAHQDFMNPSSGYADGGQVQDSDSDKSSEFDKAGKTIAQGVDPEKLKQFHPFNQGGIVPEKGTTAYLEHLMSQLHGKKNYADGTVDEFGGVVPQPQDYPAPEIDPALAQQASQQPDMPLPETKSAMDIPEESKDEESPKSSKAKQEEVDKEIEESVAKEAKDKEDRKPASDESEEDDQMEKDLKPDEETSDDEEESDEKEMPKTLDTSSDALRRAQEERASGYNRTDMLKYGNLIGSGAAKTNALPESFFSSLNKAPQSAVESYKEQVANQQDDPNSPMSQVVKQYMNSKGFNTPENASAADLFKVAPFLAKDSALQNAIQKVLIQQTVKQQEGEKNRQSKEKIAGESAKGRDAQTKAYDKRTEKQATGADDRKKQTRFDQYAKALREGGDQSVKLSRQNIVRAKNLFLTNGIDPDIKETDVDKIPDAKLNKVNRINVIENGIELNRLLSGSNQSAQSTLNKLVPNNINMTATQIQDYMNNKLNPAQQAQALKSYMKIAARARDLNHGVVENYHKQIMPAAKQVFDYFPDQSAALKDEFKNQGFDLNPTKSKGSSDQSATGKHMPGDIVEVKGKQYRVGADGDSLEPIQ